MPRVYNEWSKQEYIHSHVPEEFKALAKQLTTIQIQQLSEAIDTYRNRMIAFEREHPRPKC